MTAPRISHVIFDMGNVLVTLDDREAFARLAQLTGEEAKALRGRFMAELDWMVAYETGRLTAVEYYRESLRMFGLDRERYPYRAFRDNWCSVLVRCPEMEQLFFDCCAAVTSCVLSNTNALHWDHVAASCELLQRAHHTLTSYQCGLFKPDPAIFRLALERFGVADPAAASFIDDRPDNVAAARAVGMTESFLHVDPRSTRQHLVELGVLRG
jgi:FMN phosphatase YigB (HAD superfamily)